MLGPCQNQATHRPFKLYLLLNQRAKDIIKKYSAHTVSIANRKGRHGPPREPQSHKGCSYEDPRNRFPHEAQNDEQQGDGDKSGGTFLRDGEYFLAF